MSTQTIRPVRLLWLHWHWLSFTVKPWASWGNLAMYEQSCQVCTWSQRTSCLSLIAYLCHAIITLNIFQKVAVHAVNTFNLNRLHSCSLSRRPYSLMNGSTKGLIHTYQHMQQGSYRYGGNWFRRPTSKLLLNDTTLVLEMVEKGDLATLAISSQVCWRASSTATNYALFSNYFRCTNKPQLLLPLDITWCTGIELHWSK